MKLLLVRNLPNSMPVHLCIALGSHDIINEYLELYQEKWVVWQSPSSNLSTGDATEDGGVSRSRSLGQERYSKEDDES